MMTASHFAVSTRHKSHVTSAHVKITLSSMQDGSKSQGDRAQGNPNKDM